MLLSVSLVAFQPEKQLEFTLLPSKTNPHKVVLHSLDNLMIGKGKKVR